jgi:hypothetical protein
MSKLSFRQLNERLFWPRWHYSTELNLPWSKIVGGALSMCKKSYQNKLDDKSALRAYQDEEVGIEWFFSKPFKTAYQPRKRIFYLVFRGTQGSNFTDWSNNCRCWPNAHGFHNGWYEAVSHSFPHIIATLLAQDFMPSDWLVITGHSRGGSFASIATELLTQFAMVKYLDQPKIAKDPIQSRLSAALVTFGAPTVSDEWHRILNLPYFHIRTKSDPVPHLMKPLRFEDHDAMVLGQRQFNVINAHSLDSYHVALSGKKFEVDTSYTGEYIRTLSFGG